MGMVSKVFKSLLTLVKGPVSNSWGNLLVKPSVSSRVSVWEKAANGGRISEKDLLPRPSVFGYPKTSQPSQPGGILLRPAVYYYYAGSWHRGVKTRSVQWDESVIKKEREETERKEKKRQRIIAEQTAALRSRET